MIFFLDFEENKESLEICDCKWMEFLEGLFGIVEILWKWVYKELLFMFLMEWDVDFEVEIDDE